MRRTTILVSATGLLLLPLSIKAQSAEEKIANAMSAAPASVAEHATIMDWDDTKLREGTNGWTCFPDFPDSPGNDPMCLDEPWLNWLDAWVNKKEPSFGRMGFGYMLGEGSPGSNVDPYAEGPTPDNEWLDEGVPHLMIIVPDPSWLKDLATDANQGGPWIMWRETPYVHIMVPMPKN